MKRKSSLTIGKKYVKTKYRKVEAPKCNTEPQMDWNFETRGIFEPVQNSCTPSKVYKEHEQQRSEDGTNGNESVNTVILDPFEIDPEHHVFGNNIENMGGTKSQEFPKVLNKMEEIFGKIKDAGQELAFVSLFTMILEDIFPFHSIAFLLFSEFVIWLSNSSTTCMRYSDTSKEFWWTGMKMFGGRFVRFMQGFKHKGSILAGESPRGMYDPFNTSVNFAVPSESILNSFCPIDSLKDLKGEIEPGIVNPLLEMYAETSSDKSHVLSFDGKKIIPNSADIDLIGCEDTDTIYQQKCLKTDDAYIKMTIGMIQSLRENSFNTVLDIPVTEKSVINSEINDIFKHIGSRLQMLRDIKRKKAYTLTKLEAKSGTDGTNTFFMNFLKTFLQECRNVSKEGLSNLNELCAIMSALNGTYSDFEDGKFVDLAGHSKYAELLPPCLVRQSMSVGDDEDLSPNVTKQRTEEWFKLRKKVKVTGSTVGKATGVNSLKEKKEFFDESVDGKSIEVPQKQNEAMAYGTKN